ncbi:MAG: ABC transporter permease [Bacteroidales bacterium]|nr:ABC transporter permease [Bacteroidales bacterium]MDY0196679.1 ABC transporter permease [Tenuifilaceae bacterium]
MSHIILPLKVEFIKLFRKSNVLFLLVLAYLYLTPISTLLQETKTISNALELYTQSQISLSIISLLVMAIFFTNSIGNDFVEGSYRKLIAIGLNKKEYIIGKLLLTLLFSTLIFGMNLSLYLILGITKLDTSLSMLSSHLTVALVLNQILSLFTAGVFGFLFIAVFRNRVVGLVFFPLWLSIEFTFRLMEYHSEIKILTTFSPGNALFNLYNTLNIEFIPLIIVVTTCILFITIIYQNLKHRDEKSQQLQ